MWHAACISSCLVSKRPSCVFRLLLGTIAALGVAHGISFSASYQLVARFANKNTIALGLGCVGRCYD